ncbi:MAG: transposase [Gammaproteobacteria bacterium]|nr:transposase [Gammaproteobacteria bacterium]
MYYHAKDLRHGRFSEYYRPYLITTVTHERNPVFSDFDTARVLIREMQTTCSELRIESLAWVLMPDHLHWLFVLRHTIISEVVRRVKGKSAYVINRHRGYHAKVWQKGFHDHAIRKEGDIKAIARYIIANPLRAGLVLKIGDYPFWDAVWL